MRGTLGNVAAGINSISCANIGHTPQSRNACLGLAAAVQQAMHPRAAERPSPAGAERVPLPGPGLGWPNAAAAAPAASHPTPTQCLASHAAGECRALSVHGAPPPFPATTMWHPCPALLCQLHRSKHLRSHDHSRYTIADRNSRQVASISCRAKISMGGCAPRTRCLMMPDGTPGGSPPPWQVGAWIGCGVWYMWYVW